MQVTINGESQVVDEAITIAQLVERLGLGEKRIAVEVNEAIIPRGKHAETVITDGDRIEIIHAIGGG